MEIFFKIAEQKIKEAIERGELDNLPGSGKPLNLEDDAFVPEDLRAAYRVLKNAGYLPPELELRKEIVTLKELIMSLDDDKERLRRWRQLNFKIIQLNEMRKRPFNLSDFPEYEERLFKKLAGG
ncbi:MAG: DUF1992 domain-containing protein [Nitrospirae bacterium]|nr:MAG: DUF1992 domain-containing protein [Nitrospirota bacterium]